MNPIDPRKPPLQSDDAPMAPPFVDENPEIDLVRQGLDVAEDEIRDAVADAYEADALRSDDPEESLDDIDYAEGQAEREGPDSEPG